MMNKPEDDIAVVVSAVAKQAMQDYVCGLLSVSALTTQIYQELAREEQQDSKETTMPSPKQVKRIAQRLCSRVLCEAWQAEDRGTRNRAFENIMSYLRVSLLHTSYAQRLPDALEDVLQQTMEQLQLMATRKPFAGPGDSAAFIKWTQTILVRQAHAFIERSEQNSCFSLEQQEQCFFEQFVDTRNRDPLEEVLQQEMRAILVEALLSLRNPRYRTVLLATYLLNLDEQTIAQRMQVSVQDVYLWRHRGLKALHKRPEIVKLLHSLLE